MRLLPILLLVALPLPTFAESKIDFNRDIRPILSEHCLQCHGPDAAQRKAKLRLDVREVAVARKAIVPGKVAESEAITRIFSKTEDDVMPPPSLNKNLSNAQKELLKQWVAQGAEYQGHWAFLAPVRPPVPQGKHPVDTMLRSRLEKAGLTPSAEADRVTLIRRLYFDLTGLPPTIAEVDAFVKDTSANAYEKLVDHLLASPRFGERMALDWLDAARFADTHGYHIDSGRDMTRWREWVIDSYNRNRPYNQFIVEQIAGDLLPNATISQKIASGFNRNNMINYEGGAIPEEYRNAYVVDRVNTTTTVFLGLTMACAQCHDHKYDPLSQKEYYQFYAFFNNIPENGLDGQRGNAVPVLKVPTTEQDLKLQQARQRITDLEKRLSSVSTELDAAQGVWEKSVEIRKTEWAVLEPKSLTASGGGKFEKQSDNSWRISGANPAKETYSILLKSPLAKTTGFRVETLPDATFPANGPGRSANGNFVLTGVRLFRVDGNKSIPIRDVSADFSQVEYPVKTLLQRSVKGWAIHPEVGKPHHLTIEPVEAIAAEAEVRLELDFHSMFSQHQAGRLRFSVTDSASPHLAETVPAGIADILKIAPEKRNAPQKTTLRDFYRKNISPVTKAIQDEIASARKSVTEIEKSIPDAMVMQEMPNPRDTFIRIRGQYDKTGDKVKPDTPAVLPPLKPAGERANRLDLANWLVRSDNPLVSRVLVNRFWQMLFGTGLVKTSEDFGSQGEWPSHPELLDYLAVDFMESGWDVKRLLKVLLMSETYRQSSVVSKEGYAKDPENRLLSRMSRLRLPAEFIRDQALTVSGLINGEIGGASVSPYQPKGIWEELTFRQDNANFTAQIYSQSHGKDLYRRTMYTFWKRTAPPPTLTTLDAPDRETCTVPRSRTNTPLQALILMNDPTYVEASRKFAERILAEGGTTPAEKVTFAFRTVLARQPSAKEISILLDLLETQRLKYTRFPEAAKKLLKVGESPVDEKREPVELAAWSIVASTLLNLDEAITRN